MKERDETKVADAENELLVSAEEKIIGVEELSSLIKERRVGALRRCAEETPSPDLAALIEELDDESVIFFYRLMPKDIAAEVFIEMSADVQKKLIDAFTDKELADTLSELYLDDTVDIIEEMPALVVKRILKNSAPEDRSAINQLLKYPKGSAGSIMTTEYVRLKQDMTVDDALAHIRQVAIDKETIYTCYVTDKDRRLLGIVTARSLMISPKATPISEIMAENVIFAETTESEVDVADKFNKYGFIALPVVDAERRLVGIITVDDAMEVMREKTEEDFAKMAAMTPSDKDYLKTGVFSIFKSRIPWLLILMISATFSSAILSFFEASLIPALVLFVPMLMDTGGNSGSQASVTAIRGLSTKEIETSDIFRVLKKEFIVGVLCGVCLGIVSFGKVLLVDRLIMGNEAVTVSVALALSVSLMATIILAKVIGCSLPLLIKRIGFDPAVMASPFITTIVDALGLIVYFIISANVFGLTV